MCNKPCKPKCGWKVHSHIGFSENPLQEHLVWSPVKCSPWSPTDASDGGPFSWFATLDSCACTLRNLPWVSIWCHQSMICIEHWECIATLGLYPSKKWELLLVCGLNLSIACGSSHCVFHKEPVWIGVVFSFLRSAKFIFQQWVLWCALGWFKLCWQSCYDIVPTVLTSSAPIKYKMLETCGCRANKTTQYCCGISMGTIVDSFIGLLMCTSLVILWKGCVRAPLTTSWCAFPWFISHFICLYTDLHQLFSKYCDLPWIHNATWVQHFLMTSSPVKLLNLPCFISHGVLKVTNPIC